MYFLHENKSSNGKKFCFYLSLVFCCPSVYQIFGISTHLYTHIINKLLHGWFVCTIFIIHLLWRIAKLTRSLRSLIRLTTLHNSWIKIVRTHQPWSNLYIFERQFCYLAMTISSNRYLLIQFYTQHTSVL